MSQVVSAILLVLLVAGSAGAQAAPPATAALVQKVEAYLRHVFAWGPSFQMKISPPVDSPAPGFYQVNVEITLGTDSDSAIFYVSKDGRFVMRGDLLDTSTDPFAANRARMNLADSPSKGPADAAVTVVEYSDFQCPHCRELWKTLREIHARYPQIRVVYKDLPLVQIHPWAMTASLAGRCTYQQTPDAFWKVHDSIFEQQEQITPENAYPKMLEFATQAGLDVTAFRLCMAAPETKKAIEDSVAEAKALRIANTPTSFVNGRRIIGGDANQFHQFISFELAAAARKP